MNIYLLFHLYQVQRQIKLVYTVRHQDNDHPLVGTVTVRDHSVGLRGY